MGLTLEAGSVPLLWRRSGTLENFILEFPSEDSI
jgi:hypothetical protein